MFSTFRENGWRPAALAGPASDLDKREGIMIWMWILKENVFALLRHKGGANAVEYALIMALVAVFIIAAVVAMATQIGTLFNNMASCLGDAPSCDTGTFN